MPCILNDPFCGDPLLAAKVAQAVIRNDIDLFFETGTNVGATTEMMSHVVDRVISCEVDKSLLEEASRKLESRGNVKLILKSSPVAIRDEPDLGDGTMFFLDAHWESYWPLLDELREIEEKRIMPVIVIHDFKSADGLGFDSYDGVDLDWDYVKGGIEAIYGADGYRLTVSEKGYGAKRGWAIIEKK